MAAGNELERICNIAGYPIYPWAADQLKTRSKMGSMKERDDANILYLANKGAWVRVVSSVNLEGDLMDYYRTNINLNIARPQDLAESYVLYGGTSEILSTLTGQQGMNLRSGIGNNGSYNLLGDKEIEIQDYGYKPMPGITSVTIESTGRLGSLRQATVNFKVWDKYQLDIMDALYFRPGFTVLIEYGHAKYYTNDNTTRPAELMSSEQFMINPFTANLTKEDIGIQIATNIQKSYGNYGGMLGMVTQFNFTMTQDGGYDCTIKALALGGVMGNFPINHASTLPDVYYEQLLEYLNHEKQDEIDKAKSAADEKRLAAESAAETELKSSKDEWAKLKISDPFKNLLFNTDNYGNLKVLSNSTIITSPTALVSAVGTYGATAVNVSFNSSNDPKLDSLTSNYKNSHDISKSSTSPNTKAYYLTDPSGLGIIYFSQLDNINDKYIAPDAVDKQEPSIYTKLNVASINSIITNKTDSVLKIEDGVNTQYNWKTTYTNYFDVLTKENKTGGYYIDYIYFGALNPHGTAFSINLQFPSDQISKAKQYFIDPNTQYKIKEVYSNVAVKNQQYGILNTFILLTVFDNGQEQPYQIRLGGKEANSEGNGRIADLSFIGSIEGPQNLTINKPYQDYQKAISAAQDNQKKSLEGTQNTLDAAYDTSLLKKTTQAESTLELMLRSVLVFCYNHPDRNAVPPDKYKSFIRDLFSEGAYTQIFKDGLPGKRDYTEGVYKTYMNGTMSAKDRLEVNLRFGNNFYLMSGENAFKYDATGFTEIKGNMLGTTLKPVDFEKLFNVKAVQYGETADLEIKRGTQNSVYINLGLFFLFLNHTGILYETTTRNKLTNGDVITPMCYVDFNPNTNYYLSSVNQISIDPYKFLVPYTGGAEDYKKLFESVIEKGSDEITVKLPGSKTPPSPESLFTFGEADTLSYFLTLNNIGTDGKTSDGYTGQLMNVMVNINYLLETISRYRSGSDTNEVYFQTIIEAILNDLNKCMGNYNAFRLSYNDNANCFVITDDQLQTQPDTAVANTVSEIIKDNTTYEIPIYGKKSIARSFEIRTDISTRLASMLAISSNPGASNQVATGKNTSDFGVYNTGSLDRYIPVKVDGSKVTENGTSNVQEAEAAINFNRVVKSIYTDAAYETPNSTATTPPPTPYISKESIGRAMSYYIDKMAHIKNSQSGSVHAMIIPLKTNITMDGMAGLYPFQLFTVDENVLPYRYSRKNLTVDGQPRRVAFSIARMTHTIAENQWTTSVEGFMTLLRNPAKQTASDRKAPSTTPTTTVISSPKTVNSNIKITWPSDKDIKFYLDTLSGIGASPGTIGPSATVSMVKSAKNSYITNLIFLFAWAKAETPLPKFYTAFNPFNTTLDAYGGVKVLGSSAGVRAYPDYASGVKATVATLLDKKHHRYDTLVTAMKSNADLQTLSTQNCLITWGTGKLVNEVLSGNRITPPPIKGNN